MFTGEKLRLLRIVKGLKQQSVATKLGITQQAYSKLEKKDIITDAELEKIIRCVRYTLEDLEIIKKISSSAESVREM